MSSQTDIHNLYQQVAFWHGTGRYRYQEENGSKYDGVKYCTVADTLKDILSEGLKPQFDFFNEQGLCEDEAIKHTLSLSTNRIYARLYAQLFESEKDTLKYPAGSRLYWWIKIGGRMLMKDQALRKEVFKNAGSPEFSEFIEKWSRSFHNMSHRTIKPSKYRNMYEYFKLITRAKSDITNNYPIIIGVKKNIVQPIPLKYFGLAEFETRTIQKIESAHWSHIEVPAVKKDETEQILRELKIQLPVIALESAEKFIQA